MALGFWLAVASELSLTLRNSRNFGTKKSMMTWLIVAIALSSFLCFAMAFHFSGRPGPKAEAREDNLRLAGMLLFVLALILFAFREEAAAHDLAAWSDPLRDEWYRSLKVPQSKTSCCDMRDGAGIDPDKVRQDAAGNWWVDLGKGFVPVPPRRRLAALDRRAPLSLQDVFADPGQPEWHPVLRAARRHLLKGQKMVIVIFALGYFTLKLIDDVVAEPPKRLLRIVTCVVAIALIFLFGVGPIRIG